MAKAAIISAPLVVETLNFFDSLKTIETYFFIIPGFVIVWSYRHTRKNRHQSDFEYLMLSIVWGFINLMFVQLISREEAFRQLLRNIYATTVACSCFGLFFGTAGGFIANEFDKFNRSVNWRSQLRKGFNILCGFFASLWRNGP